MQIDYDTTLFGYYSTDITGDGVVDIYDYNLEQVNYDITIFAATPW